MDARLVRYAFALLLIFLCPSSAKGATQSTQLHGSVVDEDGKPVGALEVSIQSQSGKSQSKHTDIAGAFEFSVEAAGEYQISLNKSGYFRLSERSLLLKEGYNEFSFIVNHETEIHEQVEVYSSSETIKSIETSHQEALIAREIRDIPVPSTHDLRNSLQALPEVVRDNSGQLHVAGGRTAETQYLLDGFDIGDPVTGNLSVRINVDSVQVAEVESGRFSSQYGNAGAGVLAVDTAVGDDRWRAGASNFVPGFSLDRGLHCTSWYPRLTLSGPLARERAWFSEALSVQRTLSLVHEQPREADSITQWAGDNMLRTQLKLTPKNMLQGNFLYNQRNASNLGLAAFSPISTTRGLRAYRSFISLKEQVWSGRTFYGLGAAIDFGHTETLPHGTEPYVVTPNGSAGNHFELLRQRVRRWQGFGSAMLPTRRLHGTHDLQFGANVAATAWNQSSQRNAIEVRRADATVVQRTVFWGVPQFQLSDTYVGGYFHDSWHIVKALVIQFGFRTDWDRILQRATPSPRISANWLPFSNERSKFTAAWGMFLQPVALSSVGPAYDQQRADTFFDKVKNVALGPVTSTFLFPTQYLRQPRFYTFSAGWEQTIRKGTHAEINFTQRNGRLGLAYERAGGNPLQTFFLLQNNRRDRYRSVQLGIRHSFTDKTNVSFNFTRSRTETNQVFDYSLDTLVFSRQQSGALAWDAPNRLVSSGWAPVPFWGLFLSYFFEYRTGFPFSVVNEQQQLVGPANARRFPDYSSLNLGIEKRIHLLTRNWAVRLTIMNLTSHQNPDSVINNIDSPDFMRLGGGQKRAFSARLRLIG
jgi:hypothetical protein